MMCTYYICSEVIKLITYKLSICSMCALLIDSYYARSLISKTGSSSATPIIHFSMTEMFNVHEK